MTYFNKIAFASVAIAIAVGGTSGAQAGAASAYMTNGMMYCYNQNDGRVRHFGPCTSLYRKCDILGCNLQRRYW